MNGDEPLDVQVVPVSSSPSSRPSPMHEKEGTTGDNPSSININYIMGLILANNVWTIVMTFVPVFCKFSGDLHKSHPGWYGFADIIRFLEPIVALPLNFWILHASGIFQRHYEPRSIELATSVSIFMVGAAIYEQGAGFHSASTMYKHAAEQIMVDHPEVPELKDMYKWIRDVWEHEVRT